MVEKHTFFVNCEKFAVRDNYEEDSIKTSAMIKIGVVDEMLQELLGNNWRKKSGSYVYGTISPINFLWSRIQTPLAGLYRRIKRGILLESVTRFIRYHSSRTIGHGTKNV